MEGRKVTYNASCILQGDRSDLLGYLCLMLGAIQRPLRCRPVAVAVCETAIQVACSCSFDCFVECSVYFL